MLRCEMGSDDMPSAKARVFKRLRYRLSDAETACVDKKAN